jgi:hypothetical protein
MHRSLEAPTIRGTVRIGARHRHRTQGHRNPTSSSRRWTTARCFPEGHARNMSRKIKSSALKIHDSQFASTKLRFYSEAEYFDFVRD